MMALCATAPASAQPGALRTFGAWALGCDVSRTCTALGTRSDDEVGAFIHLERGGAARDSLRVTVGWWTEARAQRVVAVQVLAVTTSPRRHVDTVLVAPALSPDPAATDEDDYRLLRLDASATRRLIASARRAQLLLILSASGDTITQSSLVGMSAAMLAIDDAQKRIGTSTALARRGTRDPATMPTAPTLPRVRVQPFAGPSDRVADSTLGARLRRRIGKQLGSDCDSEDAAAFDEVEPLSASQTLVGLNCSRGAYNLWSRWYVVSNRNVQTAAPAVFLDQLGAKRRKDDGFIVNGGYDAASGRFGAFSKARGLGDCGSASEWGWDGARFLLLERREFYECRGVTSDWWPVTWRARQIP